MLLLGLLEECHTWEEGRSGGTTNKARSHTYTQAQATQPLHRGPLSPIVTSFHQVMGPERGPARACGAEPFPEPKSMVGLRVQSEPCGCLRMRAITCHSAASVQTERQRSRLSWLNDKGPSRLLNDLFHSHGQAFSYKSSSCFCTYRERKRKFSCCQSHRSRLVLFFSCLHSQAALLSLPSESTPASFPRAHPRGTVVPHRACPQGRAQRHACSSSPCAPVWRRLLAPLHSTTSGRNGVCVSSCAATSTRQTGASPPRHAEALATA